MAVPVQQSVKRTLFTMTFRMLAGTFAMNAYSLTDTTHCNRRSSRVYRSCLSITHPEAQGVRDRMKVFLIAECPTPQHIMTGM